MSSFYGYLEPGRTKEHVPIRIQGVCGLLGKELLHGQDRRFSELNDCMESQGILLCGIFTRSLFEIREHL